MAAADNGTATPAEPASPSVCIVSGEHLNAGEVVPYTYKEEGKPDRHLRFCCRRCLARFKADPQRYLKKLDDIEAGRPPQPEGSADAKTEGK